MAKSLTLENFLLGLRRAMRDSSFRVFLCRRLPPAKVCLSLAKAWLALATRARGLEAFRCHDSSQIFPTNAMTADYESSSWGIARGGEPARNLLHAPGGFAPEPAVRGERGFGEGAGARWL